MSFNVSVSVEWLVTEAKTPLSVNSAENPSFDISIYPSWYKQIGLEWQVPPEFGNCVFNVYFSPTEAGPFEKLNLTPITGTFFADTTTQEYSKFERGWYIVEAILLDNNGMQLRSKPATWDYTQTDWVKLRSIEIQRREYILLERFVGVKSYLFRRKTYGKRCTSCWNSTIEQVTNDHCPVCIGTSFEGGYFDPVSLRVQYETTPSEKTRVYYGKLESNQIGGWTISMPVVNSDDIIVREGDWAMYRVDRAIGTELQINTVRQIMTLTQLAKNDVEYQLIKRRLDGFPVEYTA